MFGSIGFLRASARVVLRKTDVHKVQVQVEPGLWAGVGFSRQLGRSSPAQGQPVPYSIWLAFLLYTLNSLAHVFEFRGFLRADSIAERNTI